MVYNPVNDYYKINPLGCLYPSTSFRTLNPFFTKTSISVSGGSVTFHVRDGTKLSDTMIHMLNMHNPPPPPPNEEDMISRLD